MVLAADVDWWARGLGLAGVASFVWNVWLWRRTNRVSLKVRSTYGNALGTSRLDIKITNRGSTPIIVAEVKRHIGHRPPGRRWGGWTWTEMDDTQVDWPEWSTPAGTVPTFARMIPAGDSFTASGHDTMLSRPVMAAEQRWGFRVVLEDGRRFRSRAARRKRSNGELRVAWFRDHRWTTP